MNVKIIAIIIVAIVVVATGGYFAYTLIDKDDDDKFKATASLSVFGNANEDNTIDSKDIKIVEDIIDGKKTLNSYPFADVNNDGIVNSADIDLLNKIVDREKTEMFVLDHEGDTVKINYPLKNVVTHGSNTSMLLVLVDAVDKVAGYLLMVSAFPTAMKPYTDSDAKLLSASVGNLSLDGYTALIDLDGTLHSEGGVGAVFIDQSRLGSYEDDIKDAMPVLSFNSTDPILSIDSTLTIGFIMGEDSEKKGVDYDKYSRSILNEVESKMPELNKRTKSLTIVMGYYLCGDDSSYTRLSKISGANDISGITGTGNEKMSNKEVLAQEKYKDAEVLISARTLDLVILDLVKVWENYDYTYYTNSPAYESMFYINVSMPVVARVAYIAEQLYPDLMEGYGDKVFQHVVDDYMTYLDKSVTDGNFDVSNDVTPIITYEDYKKAKG